jgi:exo-beta-1,3-glucanase (GH17 family)
MLKTNGLAAALAAAISQILRYTDFIAVSSYPFTLTADPGLLPADHFGVLADLAPDKPFAVDETGWPAEDVTAPYPVTRPASVATQRAYVERLLADAEELSAVFVMWFVSRDYDDLWESYLQFQPNAALLRLWRDNGLYAGDGQRRPALETWRGWLAHRRAG